MNVTREQWEANYAAARAAYATAQAEYSELATTAAQAHCNGQYNSYELRDMRNSAEAAKVKALRALRHMHNWII